MSEFRVVEANGQPYPPHAQPCHTLDAALRRRAYYESVQAVSGEARMPVKPLRIERRSMVVSMWEPWNVGAACAEKPETPFFTEQQDRALDRCEAFDAANPEKPETDT